MTRKKKAEALKKMISAHSAEETRTAAESTGAGEWAFTQEAFSPEGSAEVAMEAVAEAPAGIADETSTVEKAATSFEVRLEELELELERWRAEAESASDRALRTLAEFDNYRRRNEKDRERARLEGVLPVLRELLEVADNFDRALEHVGQDVPKAFLEGMRLVASGLHDLLDRRGVSRIASLGTPFDPEIHEALTSAPSEDVEPNTIIREVQPGYRWGDRVLRPAKVIVATAIQTGQNE